MRTQTNIKAGAMTFSRTSRYLKVDRSGRRLVGFLIVALLAGWAGWFVLGRVTVHEVTAKARLEVQSAAHAVSAPVGGQVVETRLVIGREIEAGEVLVVLDATAERRALEQKRTCHRGIIKRLEAIHSQIDAEQLGLDIQKKARGIALEQAQTAIAQAKIQARLTRNQAQANASLAAKQALSGEEYRKSTAAAETCEAEVTRVTLSAAYLEQDSLVKESDRKVLLAKLQSEAVALEAEAANEEAAVAGLEHAIELRVIRASVAGRVGEAVAEVQVGSVVRAADKLGTIIPAGEPRAVALFPAAAIGRIRPGQTARLRLDGFPWTQYGTLAATVVQVGNEGGNGGLIRVELALAADPSSLIPLGHGLPGTAEVAVEQVSPATLVLRGAGLGLTSTNRGRE